MFWITKAALKHMPDDGAIINTTSINAFRGHPTLYVCERGLGALGLGCGVGRGKGGGWGVEGQAGRLYQPCYFSSPPVNNRSHGSTALGETGSTTRRPKGQSWRSPAPSPPTWPRVESGAASCESPGFCRALFTPSPNLTLSPFFAPIRHRVNAVAPGTGSSRTVI